MGARFPKDKGGYLTSDPIGKIQMSIKEPKRVGNYFLVLFNQPLNSPRSSWEVISLGKGEYGQSSILAGLSDFDPMLSQERSLTQLPSRGGRDPHSSITEVVEAHFPSCGREKP